MNDNSSHKQPVHVGVNHLNTDKENQPCKQWIKAWGRQICLICECLNTPPSKHFYTKLLFFLNFKIFFLRLINRVQTKEHL